MEKKVLKIEGMSCEHCVQAVTNALNVLPGLEGVTVNLEGGTVSFSYNPSILPLSAIKTAIIDAGYEAAE